MASFNTILILGAGSVGQCFISLLIEQLGIPAHRITIIDRLDRRQELSHVLAGGGRFILESITSSNYVTLLSSLLKQGDICIDLGLDIDTVSILSWCFHHGIHYLNSSLCQWPHFKTDNPLEPTYERYYHVQEFTKTLSSNGPTCILTHGANPGLVSHFVKQALIDIAQTLIRDKPHDPRRTDLEQALADHNFAQLAWLESVKVIHISERDSQIIDTPKRTGEFVNTWSPLGLAEEATCRAELCWGTHEYMLPCTASSTLDQRPRHLCLDRRALFVSAYSWVPSGEIIGMMIPHEEIFEISERLMLRHKNTITYAPTMYYVYKANDNALLSLGELAERRLVMQEQQRVITNEIIEGANELGCLLMGHDYTAWWSGSVLPIATARSIIPDHNATTLQVAASLAAAFLYLVEHPNQGIRFPFDLDHESILAKAQPFLGSLVSQPVTWTPLPLAQALNLSSGDINHEHPWVFGNFLKK